MRVWHVWVIMLAMSLGMILYTRGIVDGVSMAGHADIVGWSWWKLSTLSLAGTAGLIAWTIVDSRKRK